MTPEDTGTATDGALDSGDTDSGNADSDPGTSDACGDPGVIHGFATPITPALSPVSSDSDHGSDNVYAPDVVPVSDSLCLMYYGGQGARPETR